MYNITDRVIEKLQTYQEEVYNAIKHLSNDNIDDAFTWFRKSGEACMKAILYAQKGDEIGHDIITGKKDVNGNSYNPPNPPMSYNDLLTYCEKEKWISGVLLNDLQKIKRKGNPPSHDPNEFHENESLEEKRTEILDISRDISYLLFSYFGQSIPTSLENAYRTGSVDNRTQQDLRMEELSSFIEEVNGFNKSDRYILIAPDSTNDISEDLLRTLSGISWAVIIDFNSKTKEERGLYHSMMPEIENNCVPLTIHNKNNYSIVSKGTHGETNWVFANGLNTLTGTTTYSLKEWIGKRYHQFIINVLREFCKKTTSTIHVISLFDNIDYLGEIIRRFDEIEGAEKDLITFNIITESEPLSAKFNELDRYGFRINVFNFSLHNLLTRLMGFSKEIKNNSIIVPSWHADQKIDWVDISDIYSKLASGGIIVVHKNIASDETNKIADIPNFYMGSTVNWKELEVDVDVRRNVYDSLKRKIQTRLQGRQQSQKFTIHHLAGAGGTTIGRRLAYDFREKVPTILINENNKPKTAELLELLSIRVDCPILAIMESSKMGDIDDLIATCNARKRIVVFVLIKRTIDKPRNSNSEFSEFVYDKMSSIEEKNRFRHRVQQYNSKSSNASWLDETPFTQCEVLDFALSIAEKNYDKKALKRYISSYLDPLSSPLRNFVAFVALIYHYGQLSVPDIIFRKTFVTASGKMGLNEYCLSRQKNELDYLQKIVIIDGETEHEDRLWRPRYAIFSELLLEELLGNGTPQSWLYSLPEWSRILIRTIKDNYDYLTDDVRKILVSVFLEREKVDLLGQEELWSARGTQDKFSQLIDDMAYSMEDQKNILKLLADSFPEDAHFWGHLARFCYENADSINEFDEALKYIEMAFDKDGQSDYNLLHIAGMCYRRKIEFFSRNHEVLEQEELEDLTNNSKRYFQESRLINPQNVYAYTSEVQLLTIVIEYGKSLSKYDTYAQFIYSPENTWYLKQYEQLNDLIDELRSLIDQTQPLGTTNKILKSKTMLAHSENKAWEYIGNYTESLQSIKNHLGSADRASLPRLRLMYVRTLLLSKVKGRRENQIKAWSLLKEPEIKEVEIFLNQNVQQDAMNVYSLRLWLQFVRYSKVNIPIEEIKSRLKVMYNNSSEYPMARLEAAYFLYILNAFELIKENDTLNDRKLQETKHWIERCKEISSCDKYPFEWLSHLDNISGIISSRNKAEETPLVRVSGTILEIKSPVQGIIRMDCGLDVFFVPKGFIKGRSETLRVNFVVSFRHEGLAAYDVERLDGVPIEKSGDKSYSDEVNIEDNEIEEIDLDLKNEEDKIKKDDIFEPAEIKKPSLKIMGKVELKDDGKKRFK